MGSQWLRIEILISQWRTSVHFIVRLPTTSIVVPKWILLSMRRLEPQEVFQLTLTRTHSPSSQPQTLSTLIPLSCTHDQQQQQLKQSHLKQDRPAAAGQLISHSQHHSRHLPRLFHSFIPIFLLETRHHQPCLAPRTTTPTSGPKPASSPSSAARRSATSAARGASTPGTHVVMSNRSTSSGTRA